MFNRLARLWGRKSDSEQDAAMPTTGQRDQGTRQGDKDKDALDRSLERYRQQSAERQRQWKEAQLKEVEAQYGPAATWPRLSETLDGPKHPWFCQSCGAERPPEAPDEATPTTGAGDMTAAETVRLVVREVEPPPGVYGWQEHDSRDKPEPIAVMLCMVCSERLIEPHPRMYNRIPRRAPFPGIMDLCIDCRFRVGVTCTHPDRVSNGGQGLQIDAAPSMPTHAHTFGGGSFVTLYAYPPRACAERSVERAKDTTADDHTGRGDIR